MTRTILLCCALLAFAAAVASAQVPALPTLEASGAIGETQVNGQTGVLARWGKLYFSGDPDDWETLQQEARKLLEAFEESGKARYEFLGAVASGALWLLDPASFPVEPPLNVEGEPDKAEDLLELLLDAPDAAVHKEPKTLSQATESALAHLRLGAPDAAKADLERGLALGPAGLVHEFDPHSFYSVAFLTKVRSAKGELVRFFFRGDRDLEPHLDRLPGESQLLEVFVAGDPGTTLASTHLLTRKESPLAAAVPGFAKQFDVLKLVPFTGVMAELIDPFNLAVSATVESEPPKPPWLYVNVARLDLHLTRATLAITDEATPATPVSPSTLRKGSAALLEQLEKGEARVSTCALAMARALDATLQAAAGGGGGVYKPDDPAARKWKRLQKALRDERDRILRTDYCIPGRDAAARILDNSIVSKTSDGFLALVTPGKATKVAATFSYENAPLQRYSLGVMTGLVTSISGEDRRAQISDGKLTADPIDGSFGMLLWNIHPVRFDPDTPKPKPAERWRVFIGTAFTPEAGIAAGVGYQIIRGLSINLGFGLMRVDELRAGESFGEEPGNPADPFATGEAEVWFFGFGYSYSG